MTKTRKINARTKKLIKVTGNRKFLAAQGMHCQEWHWCELAGGHSPPCLGAFMLKKD